MSNNNDLDPVRMMREWFVNSEKMWSDAMTEAMGDERFSKGAGRYMQEALHSHRMFSESMGQYLANLNMPTRADVLDISDKMSQMDEKMDHILVELRAQREMLSAISDPTATAAKKKPARTKKPASAS